MIFRCIILFSVLISYGSYGQSYKGRTTLGIGFAKQELKKVLQNPKTQSIIADTLIKDKQTAIQISEAILFKVYGKENILAQKPYETYFIDGYWILSGTLPQNSLGGTFLIIIKAANGQVIKLTHGK